MLKLTLALLILSCNSHETNAQTNSCNCDTAAIKKIITTREASPYDTMSSSSFYKLPAKQNRELWYKDIENTDTTRFTRLWNDYSPNNYHASHHELRKSL